MKKIIHQVDVIVPVHNAEDTIEETVHSAMSQSIPLHLLLDDNDTSNEHDDDTIQKNDLKSKAYEQHYLDNYKRCNLKNIQIDVAICCYDDGSTDQSLDILNSLKKQYEENHKNVNENENENENDCTNKNSVISRLYIGQSADGTSRGAGYARNRAASLRAFTKTRTASTVTNSFICLLDSDDVMHQHRIAEQLSVMLQMDTIEEQNRTILGCTFKRIPEDSTWHYTNWANSMTDERLMLERFREVTILQPTWFLTRSRFELLGGYIEAPVASNTTRNNNDGNDGNDGDKNKNPNVYKLIHPKYDTEQTLRLAEDLRLFHAHLLYNSHSYPDAKENCNGKCSNGSTFTYNHNNNSHGTLKLIRSKEPLLKYRHRIGQSQSSSTSRKLLLQLRAKAFVDTILLQFGKNNNSGSKYQSESTTLCTLSWLYCDKTQSGGFVIWGAGRDGKEFFKSLEDDMKRNVRCFVDVDEKKINTGYYIIPINKINDSNETGTNVNSSNSNSISGNDKRKKKKGATAKSCIKVPIVHYSLLVKNDEKRHTLMKEWMHPTSSTLMKEQAGRITKNNPSSCSVQEGTSTSITDTITKAHKRIKIDHTPKQQQNSDKNTNNPTISNDNSKINNIHDNQNSRKGHNSKQHSPPQRKLHGLSKKDKVNKKMLDMLKDLPVVVCVAMYRSNGILENNVKNIGRTEGIDLWHFS